MQIRILIPVLAILALALVPMLAPSLQVLMTLALAKGIAVMGVTLLLRAGQVSFGHALFFGIAAYAAAFAAASNLDDLFLLLFVGAAGAAVSGLLVGLFVVRYRGIFFGMLNLAFSMIFWSVLEKFYHLTGGADGLRLARPEVLGLALDRAPFELLLYYLALALTLGLGWFATRWLGSPVGQLFQTVKTNETRLEYLGISAQATLLKGYILSAVLCGLGGVLVATAQGIVTPAYAYWIRSGEMVFIAVLGGVGSIPGAVAGAIAYEVVRIYAAAFAADVWQLVLGAFLLAIILFAPSGLMGIYGALMDRISPRRAAAREEKTSAQAAVQTKEART
ncbi:MULTISPECIES: branched-chain amino acid ABC transporter permease [unclassified Roseivivax]|uniref:branched-chain amino acid ABC transporter permease n=1 Tax=Roseivivax sp. GX 12232 TaxID=2900547 RepID=UPI001E2C8682|nr:branched-chain amino acid ABC transporter permease [Roseivivax sp. GX 12232]MCE0506563.1 branched-chain amino acid ABC transporter permease [Roseivivax sp. GX 12232]